MKIELRNIKRAAFASEETDCFTATVYIDGVRAGEVSNDGHGGCNRYHPRSLEERLTAHAKTLPMVVSDTLKDGNGQPFTYQPDADAVIGDLLSAHMAEKDLKRALKSRLLWTEGAKLWQSKKVPETTLKTWLDDPRTLVKERAAGEKVLNLLPFDQALAIYRQQVVPA